MKRILLTCFMLAFALITVSAVAQERTVSGKVTGADDGLSLPQVTVLVKGTTAGVATNVDGDYRLTVPAEGATLIFRFVGYVTQEILVGNQSVINVQLQPDIQSLGEVVVTGYGTTTEERSAISSAVVSSKTIEGRPNASFVQTLSGQVAGLNIVTNSGQPGANSTVQLRGISSINGDTEPLFIMDGAPVDQDNFRSLNPNEIESITVLKDAGATAIYGNRGANGVIVITTKKGNGAQGMRIDYQGRVSFSQLQGNDYNYMNSRQQLTIENERNAGLGGTLTPAEIDAYDVDTDWVDYFFRTGIVQDHNIQIQGGGQNNNYYLSFGYLDQEGVLEDSDLQRFSIRGNYNGSSLDKKFNYGFNLSVNYSESNEPNSIGTGGINQNYVLGAYQSVPYLSPDDYVNGAALLSPLLFRNTPLFLIDKLETFTSREDEIKMVSSLNLSYELIDGLTVGGVFSADFQEELDLVAQAPEAFNSILFAGGKTEPGFQDEDVSRQFAYNQTLSLTYNKRFGKKHTMNLGAYTEYFKAHFKTFGYNQQGLISSTFYPGDGSAFVGDQPTNDFYVGTQRANILEAGLFSYFFQGDYDYDSKYGITGVIRRDASYRFADSNKWGTFYSVAGRWNIHKEDFFSGTRFNVLKLRGSYGATGNQNISGGGYFSSPDLTEDFFATGGGYAGRPALFLSQLGNSTLRWETIYQFNVGLDFEVFDSRLRGQADFYNRKTDDLYQSVPVSGINATTSINANAGSLRNTGVDLVLNYDVLRSDISNGFNLTVGLVGNYNKNEILEFPNGDEQIIGTGRVGGPLGEYYTYRYAGVNPATGNLLFYTANNELTESPNVDTDRVWLNETLVPDYQGSFNINADYKGFFFTAQLNYALGRSRFDNDYAGSINPNNIGQFRTSTDILRAWTAENRNTDIPALGFNNSQFGGTRFLRNADYLRIRFIQLGYNLPSGVINRIGLRNARVFLNAENLFTFTEWRGFDVEARSNTSRLYPTPRTVSVGLELGL